MSVLVHIFSSNQAEYAHGVTLVDDIVLLRLAEPLSYSSELQPLCLMTEFDERPYSIEKGSTQEELAASKARAEVVGFGLTELKPTGEGVEDTRKHPMVAHRGLMRFMNPHVCFTKNDYLKLFFLNCYRHVLLNTQTKKEGST